MPLGLPPAAEPPRLLPGRQAALALPYLRAGVDRGSPAEVRVRQPPALPAGLLREVSPDGQAGEGPTEVPVLRLRFQLARGDPEVKVLLSRLRTRSGKEVAKPTAEELDLAADSQRAYAFKNDRLVHSLDRPRLDHAGPDGMLLSGLEARGEAFHWQEWWCRPVPAQQTGKKSGLT